MARLSQLAGNLRIVFPPTVTIAVLFALLQQGLSLFNLATQFFRTGTEQHPAQFFYLSPQMFYFPFIFFDLFFGTCQCRAQEDFRLFNQEVEAPDPEAESDAAEETAQLDEPAEETAEDATEEDTQVPETTDVTEATQITVDEVPENTIPTSAIVIFAFGLLIAIAALILMQMNQKRNNAQDCDADDDL